MTDRISSYVTLTELASGAQAIVREVPVGRRSRPGSPPWDWLSVRDWRFCRIRTMAPCPYADTHIALGRGEATKVLAEEVAG
ncbi:MAG TPA: hypothetical protein VIE89_06765 [Candidatus Binatia bacterium]|jgi:hypothetical protein